MDRITELTIKYLSQGLDQAEQAELDAWLDTSETNKRRFEERVREENILSRMAVWDDASANKRSERKRLEAKLRPQISPVLRFMSGYKGLIAAAAILLLVVGAAIVIEQRPSSRTKSTVATIAGDLAPGGNKATLTLSTGKVIVLDSAHAGKIATEGASQVSKVTEGQISYEAGEDNGEAPVYNIITTPAGGQYSVTLADGTKVWLDAASSIRYPVAFSGGRRDVQVTGEAYFEVAHDAARPFHVLARGMDIRVIGTHFNVNAYDDEPTAKTTLVEGAVRVIMGSDSVLLAPGDQAQAGTAHIAVSHGADISQAVAWKNGFFQFNSSDIQTVMRALARWYNVKVTYEGPIPNITLTASMRRDNMASVVLRALQLSGFHFRIENDKIRIMP